MASVRAEILIDASLAEVWDLYFAPRTWRSWVSEFRGADEMDDGYPEAGGTLVWHTGPAGRGQVTETVLDHEPRRVHRIRYLDENSEGEQLTKFEISGSQTKVEIELTYAVLKPMFLPLTDRLFVRPQMRAMLTRTLEALRREASDLGGSGPER